MIKEKIENQREKLYVLISEKADYTEILKASQKLDNYIREFISQEPDKMSRLNMLIKK